MSGHEEPEGSSRTPLLKADRGAAAAAAAAEAAAASAPAPASAPGHYEQHLADEAEQAQHSPLPSNNLGRLMMIAMAALLLIGLVAFSATYAIVASNTGGPVPAPECRKSAVLVITEASSLGHPRQDGAPAWQPQRQALVWSGKGHRADLLFQDLYAMDLPSREWYLVYDRNDEARATHGPTARWKALAAYSSQLRSMVLFGGDSVVHPRGVNRYLEDLWFLDTDVAFPAWELSPVDNDTQGSSDEIFDEAATPLQKGSHPAPRRAHAGAVMEVQDVPQLVIMGGKARGGAVLGDVWAVSLDAAQGAKGRWQQLWQPGVSSGPGPTPRKGHIAVAVPGPALGAKGRWQQLWQPGVSHGPGPTPRKGHIAVAVPGPTLFVWGGRNDTAYLEDGWLFHLGNATWQEVHADPLVHQPKGRDHLGAFFWEGSVYIYGGRGGPSYGKSGPLADVWSFSLETRAWSKLHLPGPAPPARFLSSMAFYIETIPDQSGLQTVQDPRLVIYGGEGADGCYMSDMWQLSLVTRNWTELSENVPCQKRCMSKQGQR